MRQGLRVRWAGKDWDRPVECVVNLSATERQAAADILRRQLEPSGPAFVARCLAAVDAATASREKTPVDEQARRTVLVSSLEDIPADLLADACRRWVQTETFRPTAAELRRKVESEMLKRRVMLDAVTAAPKPESAPPKRVTADEVDAILKRHGHTPDKLRRSA